jgi:L-ascorbate metabolism protein UlaG (beta-lactamase superfamily)
MRPATPRWQAFDGRLADHLAAPPRAGEPLAAYWLGQAGFVIDVDGRRLLVDPYLSDSLARKYRDAKYRHVRMMASPIAPEDVPHVDLVLCTHRHTDHMDPDTLQPLARRFPALRFVVPAASLEEAARRCGVGLGRLVAADAGDDLEPLPGVRVRPVAAAHEAIQRDERGRHEWLGYVVDAGGHRLYHSGDCVPYPGLVETVAALAPQVALLPVNGRDATRRDNGVPGNFTLDEAVALCHEAGVPAMVAHHYGLFDFNTVPPALIDDRAAVEAARGLQLTRARLRATLRLEETPA